MVQQEFGLAKQKSKLVMIEESTRKNSMREAIERKRSGLKVERKTTDLSLSHH